MDAEERENPKKKDVPQPRVIRKAHKRSASQDLRPVATAHAQCNGHHHHHHHHHGHHATQALKPRISKLETLEAKMASIEVSLSNTLEQQKQQQQQQLQSAHGATNPAAVRPQTVANNGAVTHVVSDPVRLPTAENGGAGAGRESSKSTDALAPTATAPKSINKASLIKEIEKLRGRLYEKDGIISSLREQTNHLLTSADQLDLISATSNDYQMMQIVYGNRNGAKHSTNELISKDGLSKEERLVYIQNQIDTKVAAIKNIKVKLENFEVNDLDSRIHQAELECLLEKEEINILNLQQELINRQSSTSESEPNGDDVRNGNSTTIAATETTTLFSIVSGSKCTSLVAMEVPYDVQSPSFYVTAHYKCKGLIVQWSKDSSKLKKGDRLLEVNGQLISNCSKEQFLESLHLAATMSANDPLRLVALRSTPMLPLRRVNSKEVDGLKEEMSSVVNKLDTKIKENKELYLSVQKLQKELEQLKDENQRMHHRTFYLEDQVNEMMRQSSSSSLAIAEIATSECHQHAPITNTTSHSRPNVPIQQPVSATEVHRRPTPAKRSTTPATVVAPTTTQQTPSTSSAQPVAVERRSGINQLDKIHVHVSGPAIGDHHPTRHHSATGRRPASDHGNSSNAQRRHNGAIPADHHVLQVKIPLHTPGSTNAVPPLRQQSGDSLGRLATTGNIRIVTNPYANVPLPRHLATNGLPNGANGPGEVIDLDPRTRGKIVDSDSGNYSGDSNDETTTVVAAAIGAPTSAPPHLMTAFVLQQRRAEGSPPVEPTKMFFPAGGSSQRAVISAPVSAQQQQPQSNHCYVNVVESRLQHHGRHRPVSDGFVDELNYNRTLPLLRPSRGVATVDTGMDHRQSVVTPNCRKLSNGAYPLSTKSASSEAVNQLRASTTGSRSGGGGLIKSGSCNIFQPNGSLTGQSTIGVPNTNRSNNYWPHNVAGVQLKVNSTKIALNDHESDSEEWC